MYGIKTALVIFLLQLLKSKAMGSPRNSILRRVLAVGFFLACMAGNVQVLFACGLMDDPPHPVCCCTGDMSDGCEPGGGCTMHNGDRTEACCEVVVGAIAEITASEPPNFQVCMLDAPQPPPALTSSADTEIPSSPDSPSLTYLPCRPPGHGSTTYLITQRLRI